MLSTRLVYFVIDIVYIAFLREKLSKLRRAAVRDAKIGLAFSREPKFHKRTWRHIKTIVGKKKKNLRIKHAAQTGHANAAENRSVHG